MKDLIDELRMYFAEKLLDFILFIIPKNTNDGIELMMHIYDYFYLKIKQQNGTTGNR
jgi:hypothetical protein